MKFPSPAWDKISPEAIGFVQKLMDRDPEERPSAAEAMEDPWVNQELVNPFRKKWHGTFLSPATKEFQKVPQNKFVVHTDRNRRDNFRREYSSKQLKKKKKAKKRVRRWWERKLRSS